MANQEHIDLLQMGGELWNQWRKDHPVVRPDLSLANLRGTDLSYANLRSFLLETEKFLS